MAFALTYQDYASSHPQESGGSEGGQGTSSLMSEDQWNNLSDDQKWKQVGGAIALTAADPRYSDIAKGLDMSGAGGGDQLYKTILVGPGSYKAGMLTNDKNQVDLGGGVNATNWGNLSPIAQRSDTSSNFFHDAGPGLMIVGALFTAGALAGAAGIGGAAVSGSEATAAGGFTGGADIAASGATGEAAGGVSGTMTGAAGDESAGLSMTPGASAPVDESAGLSMTPGAGDESAGLNLTPSGTPSTLPAGTQAPAPVSEAVAPGAQAPAPVTDASVPGNGVINGAANGTTSTGNSLMPQWYNNMSPGARFILGQAASTGGRAAITGLAQQHAIDAQRAIVDQHRQDVIRQGQVPLLPPNTFTARPGGIINNASNNGGSGP